jgi:hypothetical protein
MDELIKQVAAKANISGDQAKQAIDTVLAFLKDKLPAPLAEQVKGVLSGQAPDLSSLGGLFGKK